MPYSQGNACLIVKGTEYERFYASKNAGDELLGTSVLVTYEGNL